MLFGPPWNPSIWTTRPKLTGIEPELIVQAACMYATHKPAAISYGMGITHFACGTENVMTVGNLAMLNGNIGKPG